MLKLRSFLLFCCAVFTCAPHSRAETSMGFLYDLFPLTLASGYRTEAAGPLFYHEKKETQRTWAVPPFFAYVHDSDLESEEFDLCYPLLSYDRYGTEYRFHIFQLFAFAGGHTQDDHEKDRFTLFPFYFQQRSSNPDLNYTALLPIYGTLKNRLFRDEIHFVMFPLYSKTTRRGKIAEGPEDPFTSGFFSFMHERREALTTYNYLYPVFHLRYGRGLRGWQVWPLVGYEHKKSFQKTNVIDEVEIIGGHEKFFALWPFFFKNTTGIDTDNPERQLTVLPLFTSMRSPKRDSSTYFWPFGLTLTDDRARKYKEFGAPWPIIVFARGEGKHTTRVWPLFSHAGTSNLTSRFYLWPVYKYNRVQSAPLDRERTRILFFLYSDIKEENTETGNAYRRWDLWPLFTKRRDLDGNERLQILSILEPVLPNNKSIERLYSPVYSLWRSEKNAKTEAKSQSLLWNLYRRDSTPTSKKVSLLFGLFQYQSNADGKSTRLFYVPLGKGKKTAEKRAAEGDGNSP